MKAAGHRPAGDRCLSGRKRRPRYTGRSCLTMRTPYSWPCPRLLPRPCCGTASRKGGPRGGFCVSRKSNARKSRIETGRRRMVPLASNGSRRRALGLAVVATVAVLSASDHAAVVSQRPSQTNVDAQRKAVTPAVSPCRLLNDRMRQDAGAEAIECSHGSFKDAIACANDAFRQRRPFLLCNGGWGMDSYGETGAAGLANGSMQFYYLDTFGPQYRGTCLRMNIAISPDGWPQCKRALAGEIDLRTGRPRTERVRLPHEENWPPSCAQRAVHAASRSMGVKLLRGSNPLPDPARWGLRCRRAAPAFEMLVDRSGSVVCARVISAGDGAPAPGLYDSIRSHLMRWRFEPPTLYGQPVEVRWGMQLNPLSPGDSAIPGPPIYPVCP